MNCAVFTFPQALAAVGDALQPHLRDALGGPLPAAMVKLVMSMRGESMRGEDEIGLF
ncbi:MAG: hypothetical protein ABI082_13460 [Dokdonella sp.]